MTRLSPLIVFWVVAAACAGSAGDGSTSSAPTTTPAPAISDDGRLVFGSVGGAPEITAEALNLTALPFGDIDVIGGYEVGPSGTEFAQPIPAVFDADIAVIEGEPVPLVAAFLEDDDGQWEILPTTLSAIDGALVVETAIPHFSRLVFLGSEQAVFLDPDDIFTFVGDEWDAYWDIVDRRFSHLTHDPGRLGLIYDDDLDRQVFGSVRDLVDQATIDVVPLAGGVVDVVGDIPPEIGTYDFFAVAPAQLIPRTSTDYVEAFFGVDRFTCTAPGSGFYGFDMALAVERPDLLFAGRTTSGQLVFVRPSQGVVIKYQVEGEARCISDWATFLSFLRIHHGFSMVLMEHLTMIQMPDPEADPIYSISTEMPGYFNNRVDLRSYSASRTMGTQLTFDHLYNNSAFGCNTTVFDDALQVPISTLCATESVPIPEGEVVVVTATYGDDLPDNSDDHHYTYAAVFESNDDSSDDWQFQGGFDWDFFIGTDRWYQIHWDPDSQAWALAVSDGTTAAGPSGARVVIIGDTVLWIIPKSELPAATPEVRVTSFVHDGTYRAEVSGGDVNGANPTEPLLEVPPLGG